MRSGEGSAFVGWLGELDYLFFVVWVAVDWECSFSVWVSEHSGEWLIFFFVWGVGLNVLSEFSCYGVCVYGFVG